MLKIFMLMFGILMTASCAHEHFGTEWDLGIPKSAKELSRPEDKEREFQRHALASLAGTVLPAQPLSSYKAYSNAAFTPIMKEISPAAYEKYSDLEWLEIPISALLFLGSFGFGWGVASVLIDGIQLSALTTLGLSAAMLGPSLWMSRIRFEKVDAARIQYNQDLYLHIYGKKAS